MASSVNADNGVVSGSAGLKSSADSTGVLELQTNGTTAVTIGTSQRVAFVAGTAALPAITTTGDTNTGMFFPAADTIAFAEGGVESMRLDSSGNLGLGVTPSAWGTDNKTIQLPAGSISSYQTIAQEYAQNCFFDGTNWKYVASTFAERYTQYNGQHQWFNAPSGTAGNAITFTQAMTLESNGNLALGTTATAGGGRFAVVYGAADGLSGTGYRSASFYSTSAVNADQPGIILGYDSAGAGIIAARTNATGQPLAFWTYNGSAWGERARIDSSGNLLVGSTSFSINTTKFQVVATSTSYGGIFVNESAGSQTIGCWNKATSGTIYLAEFGTGSTYGARGSITYNGTVVSYNATSDYRLKNTIAPMTGALAKIALLKPCTYKWNSNGFDGEGFIAHELAEVFPSAVAGEKDAVDAEGNPKYQGIDTSYLVATLTAAIQEQQAIIESLKARLDAANL